MGVQNLWMLLSPVGHQVEMESLASKTLAVDASIWLTQFVKAIRDDDGNMIANAHLIGMFHRVAKLLFYRIKPVFVFDGETPEIKKRTTAKRRQRLDQQTDNLRHTAQRLLVNRLKLVQAERKRLKGKENNAPPAVHPDYVIPDAKRDTTIEVKDNLQEDQMKQVSAFQQEIDEEMEDDDISADDIVIDADQLSNIDLEAVFALPDRLQKDVLLKIQKERRQSVRDQIIPLAGNPEAYSRNQIAAYLATSSLNKRIQKAKKRKFESSKESPLKRTMRDTISRSNNFTNNHRLLPKPAQEQAISGSKVKQRPQIVSSDSDSENEDEKRIQLQQQSIKRFHERVQQQREQEFKSDSGIYLDNSSRSTSFVKTLDKLNKGNNITKSNVADSSTKLFSRPNISITQPTQASQDNRQIKSNNITRSPTEDEILQHDANVQPSPDIVTSTAGVSIEISQDEASLVDAKLKEILNMTPAKNSNESAQEGSDYDDVEWEDAMDDAIFEQKQSEQVPEMSDVTNIPVEVKEYEEKNPKESDDQVVPSEQYEQQYEADKSEDNDYYMNNDYTYGLDNGSDLLKLRQEALESAITTASNLTQWAAGAVRKALSTHTMNLQPNSTVSPIVHQNEIEFEEKVNFEEQENMELTDDELLQRVIDESLQESKTENRYPRYLRYESNDLPTSLTEKDDQFDNVLSEIQQERDELKQLQRKQRRDTDASGLSDQMVQDVMSLLRLFGVPYLVCPMEAEAQCVELEKLGLVDGIITDDSDVFPFGGRHIYKNIFQHGKYVEAYDANDIEVKLGFGQEEMIQLALLLGSDYTDGIKGIGIVNAAEIVHAYSGMKEPLKEFKKWVQNMDDLLSENTNNNSTNNSSKVAKFQSSHASIRRKWHLGDEFPNERVIQAYKSPQVDSSTIRFSWDLPDISALREFCKSAFSWNAMKTDTILLPLMEEIAKTTGHNKFKPVQTKIDSYFRKYEDGITFAKYQSKRLQAVVQDINLHVQHIDTKENNGKDKQEKEKSLKEDHAPSDTGGGFIFE